MPSAPRPAPPQRPAGPAPAPWRALLRPGLRLKRWIVLFFAGVTLLGLGMALFLRNVYLAQAWPRWLDLLTLRMLPDTARVLLWGGAGLAMAGYGAWRFSRTVMAAVLPASQTSSRALMQALARQQRKQGPRVVAIGGGTGMPHLLRGLRAYTDNITAIVTVADDGGSSGRLRRQMGMLPPGDFRNNIAALSEAEDLMTRLFQYRFAQHESLPAAQADLDEADEEAADAASAQASPLAGHSFGNLFIATMAAVTGSFEAGIAESSRVLAVRGRVLPSTLEQVTLCAEISRTRPDGSEEWLVVEGESRLGRAGGRIERLSLKPEAPRAYPEAIRALLQADLIVACPGSFYTSLMPNLLVPAIRDAIEASAAHKVYICNVATQPGETDGYGVDDHVEQLRRHAGALFPNVLANDRYDVSTPPSAYGQWVTLPDPGEPLPFRLFTGDLVDDRLPWHHDSGKLAARLMEVYAELTARTERTPAAAALREENNAHVQFGGMV